MRGCMRGFMIMLVLIIIVALGTGFYFTIKNDLTPTSNDIFELVIYGCGLILCVFLLFDIIKWKGRF